MACRGWPRTALAIWLVALASPWGCAGETDEGDDSPSGGSGGEAGTAGAGGAAGGSGGQGGVGGSGATSTFDIRFDYRFDSKGLFDDPARRAALEAAGAQWEAVLADEFADVPAGTELLSRDPEDPGTAGQVFTIDYAIDDLVVFVGFAQLDGSSGMLASSTHSAAIGSVSDPSLSAELSDRYHGADFEPWTGWIAFDEDEPWFFDATPDDATDIPGSSPDFISVAAHELGHVLGFGASDAFVSLVDDSNATFGGAAAAASYGGVVPLSSDLMHIEASIRVDGRRPLMDPSDAAGERSIITDLDMAFMEDVGYAPWGS
ncbi:MAG: matrixin family metalloprotease [Deltaproteobacteria bacterium]|jgi:hypothetical protein|nr:matrixin family metalloprotease [Deltaproteobacteria bacterium]MBW2536533.1 matrixin family metalloprotease [Deltaproteobacteria bacterium]